MRLLVSTVLLSLMTTTAWADWSLNNEQSSIHFSSTKNSSISEIHTFKKLTGSVTKEGLASVSIDLASVETMIPIRNERLQNLLFETASFPSATISSQIDFQAIDTMAVGDFTISDVTLTVSLHGKSHDYPVKLQVTKLNNQSVLASTIAPIMVNAADFDLSGGIEKLREIAGLKAIATAVPVTATLVFSQ